MEVYVAQMEIREVMQNFIWNILNLYIIRNT
jgi:hypothetical protein